MTHDKTIDRGLSKGFKSYQKGKTQKGSKQIFGTFDAYGEAMASCEKTNPSFEKWSEEKDAFFAQENWAQIVKAHYIPRKEYFDTEEGYMLKSWENGEYFQAGMFWAEIWAGLTSIQPEPTVDDSNLDDTTQAEWIAGVLFGSSGRVTDKRDYILGCMKHDDQIDTQLSAAYADYAGATDEDHVKLATAKLFQIQENWFAALKDCTETHDEMHTYWYEGKSFFMHHDWEQVLQANFKAMPDFYT